MSEGRVVFATERVCKEDGSVDLAQRRFTSPQCTWTNLESDFKVPMRERQWNCDGGLWMRKGARSHGDAERGESSAALRP